MKLYFAWIHENETFDPIQHTQHQKQIFSFNLTEKEGEFPLATLEIQNPYEGFLHAYPKQWCFISTEVEGQVRLLFKGKLCPVPSHIKREIMALNFIAQPTHWEEELQELHQSFKTTSSWDPLFVPEQDRDDPQESLEARSELFYWCRKTGAVSLSNIFWGTHRTDLEAGHFYDSLKFRLGEAPLKSVQVSLSAQWIQKYSAQTDLTPFITSCFQEGMVNTLTGKDLEAKWWTAHEKIGQSGYRVTRSSIKEITPPFTGVLNLYPSQSPPIWVSPDDPAFGRDKPLQSVQKRLKRFWYKIHLTVGWFYQQKRVERVEFTLEQALQISPLHEKNQRHLKLCLEDLTQDTDIPLWQPNWNYGSGFQVLYNNYIYTNLTRHRSSSRFEKDIRHWRQERQIHHAEFKSYHGRFFPTDRGRKTIEHAIEIAKAHLAASARAIEISIAGPIERFLSLTCDHSVRVQDHRLPGQEAWGKVKSLKLKMDGQTGRQWGELTLGVSIGSFLDQNDNTSVDASSPYGLDYVDEDYSRNILAGNTSSQVAYTLPQQSDDQDKWIYPDALRAQDMVEKVRVKNKAVTQNDYLIRQQFPANHNIENVLKKVPTNIYLRLTDLKPIENKPKIIKVNISRPWHPPYQINLQAPKTMEGGDRQ